jgi:hypothetical protein
MDGWTTAHVVFSDGRVEQAKFPIWLLPLPGDLVTIPGELGSDSGFVPLRVTARLLQPEPVLGQPRVTLFVEAASQPRLSVVR